ncbi:MAG: hypothetical protein IAE94_11005 [Chthoniobacterales bacterium]|nr:hypothetical protein [Chthoniobacterales bacterium]
MNLRVSLAIASAIFLPLATQAADDAFRAPDSLVLKDGRTVKGLIIRNSADSVLLQQEFGETTFPKSEIVRIRDEADIDILFTDIHRKGDLPSWRVIANDLRMHDTIKSVVEIPATAITEGEFRNVPYKSFRVNRDVELNIYGDPNDPAGLEMGIYGSHANDPRLQHMLRAYLAGFLTTRAELAALYALDFKGGVKTAGDVTLEITPKDAPDAYGGWWISLYNRKDLADVKLSDAQYAALTKPVDEVIDRHGRVIAEGWTKADLAKSRRLGDSDEKASVFHRGFYRNARGDFRILDGSAPR